MANYIFPDTVGVPMKDANPKVRKALRTSMKEYKTVEGKADKVIRAAFLEGTLKGLFAVYSANGYVFDNELVTLGVKDLITKFGLDPSHEKVIVESNDPFKVVSPESVLGGVLADNENKASWMQRVYDATGHYVKVSYEYLRNGAIVVTLVTVAGGIYVLSKIKTLWERVYDTAVLVYEWIVGAIKKGFTKAAGWVCANQDPLFGVAV